MYSSLATLRMSLKQCDFSDMTDFIVQPYVRAAVSSPLITFPSNLQSSRNVITLV
jgi:hypothetical protein